MLKEIQRMGTRMRCSYRLVGAGIRVISTEGWCTFWARFKEWMVQNMPLRLNLLWWQVARVPCHLQRALLPCYQRLIPTRVREITPGRTQDVAGQQPTKRRDLHPLLQYALGLGKLGDVERARQLCNEALQEYPPSSHVWILRAKALIEIDNALFNDANDTIRSLAGIDQRANAEARFLIAYREDKLHKHSVALASNEEKLSDYWNTRAAFVYLHVCKRIIDVIARSASVVADIGSNGTPLLDFFPGNPTKYSVDPMTPYGGKGVTAVREDFLQWAPPQDIEFCTCLQVLEHVPDVVGFAKKLLEVSQVSLVSVPYKEVPGANPGHVHSMIDEKVIATWFKRAPNFHYVARELSNEERIICVFDRTTEEQFGTLNENGMHGLKYRYRWSLTGSGFEDICE